jgi:hypothetical protein
MRFYNLFAIFSVVNSTSYIEGGHSEIPRGATESVAVGADTGSDAVAVGPDEVGLMETHNDPDRRRAEMKRIGLSDKIIKELFANEAAAIIQKAWGKRKGMKDSKVGESTSEYTREGHALERIYAEFVRQEKQRKIQEAARQEKFKRYLRSLKISGTTNEVLIALLSQRYPQTRELLAEIAIEEHNDPVRRRDAMRRDKIPEWVIRAHFANEMGEEEAKKLMST